ncbi:unnamed protein product [Schistosoma margrebowiei]|uniref:Uncharacterized protein n=1 Tax=Schistosoma margrebowiei TaxID=48269 RepID=A0A183LNS2_9TREM|nr:unnamed protein product [Schistosoma margrebowiei]
MQISRITIITTIPICVTPARSRALNQPCVLLDFYDAHDVWHFLSSISMFFSFMVNCLDQYLMFFYTVVIFL